MCAPASLRPSICHIQWRDGHDANAGDVTVREDSVQRPRGISQRRPVPSSMTTLSPRAASCHQCMHDGQQDRSDNHTASAGATYDHIPLILQPQVAVVGAPVVERPLDHVMLTGCTVNEAVVEAEVFWLDECDGQAAAIVADPPACYSVQCRECNRFPRLHDASVRQHPVGDSVAGWDVTRQHDVVTIFTQFVEAVVRVGLLHP